METLLVNAENFTEWQKQLTEKCNNVVSAYAELYNHVDQLVDMPELSSEDKDIAIALISVKSINMSRDIAQISKKAAESISQG